jgi:ABC-type Na+ efflux pump permease subunit
MSRTKIFVIFIVVDLVIVAGAVWCVFNHIPVRQFIIPLAVLTSLNGLWLVWMTIRNTPPRT